MTQSELARSLSAADVAKLLPAAIAAAGGTISIAELEQKLGRESRLKLDGVRTERDHQLLQETFRAALTILQQRGSVKWDGERASLTDQGWDQARALGAVRQRRPEMLDEEEDELVDAHATIDVHEAAPMIKFSKDDGTIVWGYLSPDADRFQGTRFQPPAATLLDRLYNRSEFNGVRSTIGFYTALKSVGVTTSARALLETKCRVRLVGLEPATRVRGRHQITAPPSRGARPGRAPWARIVCEVLAELGGHGAWQTLGLKIGDYPGVQDYPAWREECRQILRNNTTPLGRSYFDIAETGDGPVYTLTPAGHKLASKRTIDDRAPALSKYFAKALSPDANDNLTEYEVYALMFLAIELGRPAEARALYHRLPEDFPDEGRYSMIPRMLERASDIAGGNLHG